MDKEDLAIAVGIGFMVLGGLGAHEFFNLGVLLVAITAAYGIGKTKGKEGD